MYEADYGINIAELPGSGAAGGLAGALAALGATLMPGFDIVAEEVDFDEAIQNTDLIITGEGLLDDTSFDGKVVGSVCDYARESKTSVTAIVGDIDEAMDSSLYADLRVSNLTQKFGAEESMTHVLRCIEEAAREMLLTKNC
jgi:glycerate kinase